MTNVEDFLIEVRRLINVGRNTKYVINETDVDEKVKENLHVRSRTMK